MAKPKYRRTRAELVARDTVLEMLVNKQSQEYAFGWAERWAESPQQAATTRKLIRHYLKGLRAAFKNGSIELGQ